MDQDFTDSIHFINEHNMDIDVPVVYKWRPQKCAQCQNLGHYTKDCAKKIVKKVWVPKPQQPVVMTEVQHVPVQPAQVSAPSERDKSS